MDKLVKQILRQGSPKKVSDHKAIAELIKQITAEDQTRETLAVYLEELSALSTTRTGNWLNVIKTSFPVTWKKFRTAAEEIQDLEKLEEEEENKEFELPKAQDEEDEDFEIMEEQPEADDSESPMKEQLEEEAEKVEEESPAANEEPTESYELPQANEEEEDFQSNEEPELEEPELEEEEEACTLSKSEEEEEEKELEEQAAEEDAVEPVINPHELKATTSYDLVLFNENTDNPHYAVFADGKPLAEIELSDQPHAEEIADAFISEEFASHVSEACSTFDPIDTLRSLKAKFYHSVIDTGTVAERAANFAENKLEQEYAVRLAGLKEELLDVINLAVQASNKGSSGQFVKNNLKQALRQAMRQAGVVNPTPIIDQIWKTQANEYFNTILAKAEEWLKYSPEALHEVTKEVLGSNAAEEEEEDVEAQDEAFMNEEDDDVIDDDMEDAENIMGLKQGSFNRQTFSKNNVPIKTMGSVAQGSYRSNLKQLLGGALRHAAVKK